MKPVKKIIDLLLIIPTPHIPKFFGDGIPESETGFATSFQGIVNGKRVFDESV
jgi:hypothetical protein